MKKIIEEFRLNKAHLATLAGCDPSNFNKDLARDTLKPEHIEAVMKYLNDLRLSIEKLQH